MTPASASLLLERGRDRDAVEHRIDRDAGEPRALVQRNAELLVGLEQLRVDLVEALRRVGVGLRRRVVRDRLVVDRRVAHVRPVRLVASSASADSALSRQSSQELRLVLLARRSAGSRPRRGPAARCPLDVGDEAVPVAALDEVVELLRIRCHACSFLVRQRALRALRVRRADWAAAAARAAAASPRESRPRAPCGCCG